MNTFFCSVFAFLSLASCNFMNNVAGNEYQLISPKYPLNITLGFNNKGGYYGQALNRYFGTYKSTDSTVTFSYMATTKMAGAPEDMKAENEYFQDFGKSMEYKIEDNKLILKNASGKELTYEKIAKPDNKE